MRNVRRPSARVRSPIARPGPRVRAFLRTLMPDLCMATVFFPPEHRACACACAFSQRSPLCVLPAASSACGSRHNRRACGEPKQHADLALFLPARTSFKFSPPHPRRPAVLSPTPSLRDKRARIGSSRRPRPYGPLPAVLVDVTDSRITGVGGAAPGRPPQALWRTRRHAVSPPAGSAGRCH